jgi:hypothetical protein
MSNENPFALVVGEPLRARIAIRRVKLFDEAQIVCGTRNCGARIGAFDRGSRGQQHAILLDGVFTVTGMKDGAPVVKLGRRYSEQWEWDRRRGVSWSAFRPRGRRAWRSGWRDRGYELEVASTWTPSRFRFACPVCRRENLADLPNECTPDCPFHCWTCGRPRRADRPHDCRPRDPMSLA